MAFNQSDRYFAEGSNSNFGTSTNFMPAIYSKKVLNFFRKASVAEAITNTDYAGEISAFGDSVKIIKEPVITVEQYQRGADTTATALTDSEITLVVDTANAFKFIVDDIETSMSHVNFKEVAASSAAYALRDAFDAGVLAAMEAGLSASAPDHILGGDTTASAGDGVLSGTDAIGLQNANTDPLDVLARLARLLDDQNVPEEGRWVVAPPVFYEELSQSDSKLLSVDYNGGQGSIRNGLVSSGKLRGFSMYKSNNMGGLVANADGLILGGHISAVCTAQTITSTEVLRDPDSFGDICRGLHVYGAKVLRPDALVSAFYELD